MTTSPLILLAKLSLACLLSDSATTNALPQVQFPGMYAASLDGAQAVPPTPSSASGIATFSLNQQSGTLQYFVTAMGFDGTSASLHTGAAGSSGPVFATLSGGPSVWLGNTPALTAQQLASLAAGGLYLQIGSASLPGGEVRGQIGPATVGQLHNATIAEYFRTRTPTPQTVLTSIEAEVMLQDVGLAASSLGLDASLVQASISSMTPPLQCGGWLSVPPHFPHIPQLPGWTFPPIDTLFTLSISRIATNNGVRVANALSSVVSFLNTANPSPQALINFIDQSATSVTWTQQEQSAIDVFVDTAHNSHRLWFKPGFRDVPGLPRWLEIVICDAVGAVVGLGTGGPIEGVILGAICSIAAASGIARTAPSASATQCFETNLGTLASRGLNPPGVGDDVLFDLQPIGFQFPFGSSSYTQAYFNSNGVMFLANGALSPLPTNRGYSSDPSTQINNLRGTAGQPPRIAPLWMDLNILASNGGGVYVNNTIPGKFVVTWSNAVRFSTTSPLFTVQAQLRTTGEVEFFYNGTLASSAATIVGVSAGNGITAIPGVDLSQGISVSHTNLHFQQFAANTIDLQSQAVHFAPTGTSGFISAASPCVPATSVSYGTGCYSIPAVGHYELSADAAIAQSDLQGNAIQWTPVGTGYISTWVFGGAAAYVPPTAGATSLVATDDGNQVVAVPGSGFPTASGLVTQFNVSSNGIIAFDATAPNASDFSPTGPEFAASTRGGFWSWHDYNPAEPGSGAIKTELVGNRFYITWDTVENYSTPTALNPSTIQFAFDLGTGDVQLCWPTIDNNTTPTFSTGHLVGWKGSGTCANSGSVDLAAGSLISNPNFVLPLALSASPSPVIGSTVTYTTSNIPEFLGGTGIYIGLHILSVNQVPNPGLDLGAIGAPGCAAFVGTLDLATSFVGITSTQSNSFAIPVTAPVGFQLFAQSMALVAPNSLPNGQNPFGLVTSNGLASTLNTF